MCVYIVFIILPGELSTSRYVQFVFVSNDFIFNRTIAIQRFRYIDNSQLIIEQNSEKLTGVIRNFCAMSK